MPFAFIDFVKTFDFKYFRAITQALTCHAVDNYPKTLTCIQNAAKAESNINDDTFGFTTTERVLQGESISPTLFSTLKNTFRKLD